MDFFKRQPKSLTKMSRDELRRTELLAEGRRKRLERKVAELANRKEELFQRGAKTKSPELRRTIAQQFEMTTTEEMMVGRTLNMTMKEAMIAGRLRTAKEQGGANSMIRAGDIAGLQKAMDKDAAAAAMYGELLDESLSGMEVAEGELGLSDTGQDVLNAWEQIDNGTLEEREALAEADKAVRSRLTPQTE